MIAGGLQDTYRGQQLADFELHKSKLFVDVRDAVGIASRCVDRQTPSECCAGGRGVMCVAAILAPS